MPTRRAFVSAFGATLLATLDASAAEPRIPPVVQVDPGACFDKETLAARVASWSRRESREPTIVRVHSEEGFLAFTVTRAGIVQGERSLANVVGTCDEQADAVALAIALAVDATPMSIAEVPAPPAPEPPPPPPPVDRGRRTMPGAPSSLTVSAAGFAAFGVLPQVVPGVTLGVDRRWTRRFETHLSVLGTTDLLASGATTTTNASVSSTLVALTAEGCLGTPIPAGHRQGRLRGCAGAAAGAVLTQISGIVAVAGSHVPPVGWGGPAARLDALFPLSSTVGVTLAVDGFLPLVRPGRSVEINDVTNTRLPPVPVFGAATGGGLTLDF